MCNQSKTKINSVKLLFSILLLISVLKYRIQKGIIVHRCFVIVGVSPPTDGLALMWHIPSKLSSEPSPRTDVMFMIVFSWGEFSPSCRLCMYYFPSIYFLSLISESCYHLNLPLTITVMYMILIIILKFNIKCYHLLILD